MIDPKTRREILSQPEADFAGGRSQDSGRGEARSFAPTTVAEPSPAPRGGEVFARWPAAWDRIDPAGFIRLPQAAPDARPVGAAAAVAPDRALIVIPCLNESSVIARVIGEVLDDDGLVDPLVMVADGGSTDGSREIVEALAAADPRVRLLPNPGRLQSAAMNLAAGIAVEGHEWLVRVDAHADYPKNYASTLIAEARRTGATSVVVAMDTKGEAGFQRAVAAAQNSVLGAGGSAHRSQGHSGWVDHGHHALFNLAAFRAVGGYDETFSHNEDAEFDLRLAQAGGQIWLTDKVRIGYHPRSAPAPLAKQYYSYGKGRARTVLKHYQPLKVRQALPLAVAPAVVAAGGGPLFWPLALPALVWVAAALGFGLLLAARRRDVSILMSGPAAMIMHLAWSAGFWAQLARAAAQRRRTPARAMSRTAAA